MEGGIGSYRPAIFYAGGMTILATILAAVVRLHVDRNLKKMVESRSSLESWRQANSKQASLLVYFSYSSK